MHTFSKKEVIVHYNSDLSGEIEIRKNRLSITLPSGFLEDWLDHAGYVLTEKRLKKFAFNWRDGKVNFGDGTGPADALNRLGYGAGALAALDYWSEVREDES